MTLEQYERVIETLVSRMERAESDESIILLMELLEGFQKHEPPRGGRRE